MEKVKGIVKGVNNKGKNYGINIDDVWYNGFNDSPVKKGDNVEVDFEINGQWKNISKITLLNEAPKGTNNSDKAKAINTDCMNIKDIFVAMYVKNRQDDYTAINTMEIAIKLGKQIRDTIENEKPEVPVEKETPNTEMQM